MDAKMQLILIWAAVISYALSSVLFIGSFAFKRPQIISYGVIITLVGFSVNGVSLLLHWIEVGHGPYLTFYEISTSTVWVSILFYLVFQAKYRSMRVLGAIVTPASLLFLGLGIMSSPTIQTVPTTFRTTWLFIHVFFAKLTYGAVLLGFGISVVYLIRYYYPQRVIKLFGSTPDNAQLDEASYRMFSFSFLVVGIMIASGSIWANQAWGRYWGWDPVETWSLISWLLVGIYLHLRIIHGWRGVKSAWLSVVTFFVVVFSLFGVIYLYHSIHTDYMKL